MNDNVDSKVVGSYTDPDPASGPPPSYRSKIGEQSVYDQPTNDKKVSAQYPNNTKGINIDLNKPLRNEALLAKYANSGQRIPTDNRGGALVRSLLHKGQYDEVASMAGDQTSDAAGSANAVHDAEYYSQWRADKQAQVQRGEDPWADFERRAKEHRENTVFGKMAKGFKGLGKKKCLKEGKKEKEGEIVR